MGAFDDPERIDIMAFSGHKLYAPYGAGALIVPATLFAEGEPMLVGGGSACLATSEGIAWASGPNLEEAEMQSSDRAASVMRGSVMSRKNGLGYHFPPPGPGIPSALSASFHLQVCSLIGLQGVFGQRFNREDRFPCAVVWSGSHKHRFGTGCQHHLSFARRWGKSPTISTYVYPKRSASWRMNALQRGTSSTI